MGAVFRIGTFEARKRTVGFMNAGRQTGVDDETNERM